MTDIDTGLNVWQMTTNHNRMIDLQARSDKLAARSRKMLIDLLEISTEQANDLLAKADGSVKVAIVCHRLGISADEARARIDEAGGFVRNVIGTE